MIAVKNNPTKKRIIRNLKNNGLIVGFETPEGYLTGDEFVSECKAFVTDYYQNNGLLQ